MDVYVRRTALCFALLVAFAGCRGTDSSIELLEHELRWMEDQLYLMDQQLSETCDQLASCRRNNTSLHREIVKLQQSGPASGDAQQGGSQDRGSKSIAPYDDADLTIPEIDLGPDSDGIESQGDEAMDVPEVVVPDRSIPQAPIIEEPAYDEPLDPALDGSPTRPDDEPLDLEDITARRLNQRVSRILLNPRLTGGYDRDGRPGDEGVMVVVEPQDATGQYQPTSGELSIVVVDPRRSGLKGRIARWDFDSVEASKHMRKSLLGRGFHLKLPWPNLPPETEKLRVYARYVGNDGRELKAQQEIRVDVTPSSESSSKQHFSQAEPRSRDVATVTATEIEIGLEDLLNPPAPPKSGKEATWAHHQVDETTPLIQQPLERTATAQPARMPAWSPQR